MKNSQQGHSYLIRVLTEDTRNVVLEDRNFSADAKYDWFQEIVLSSSNDEIVQLLDLKSGKTLLEEEGANDSAPPFETLDW